MKFSDYKKLTDRYTLLFAKRSMKKKKEGIKHTEKEKEVR